VGVKVQYCALVFPLLLVGYYMHFESEELHLLSTLQVEKVQLRFSHTPTQHRHTHARPTSAVEGVEP
jgi:hypothetical protein